MSMSDPDRFHTFQHDDNSFQAHGGKRKKRTPKKKEQTRTKTNEENTKSKSSECLEGNEEEEGEEKQKKRNGEEGLCEHWNSKEDKKNHVEGNITNNMDYHNNNNDNKNNSNSNNNNNNNNYSNNNICAKYLMNKTKNKKKGKKGKNGVNEINKEEDQQREQENEENKKEMNKTNQRDNNNNNNDTAYKSPQEIIQEKGKQGYISDSKIYKFKKSKSMESIDEKRKKHSKHNKGIMEYNISLDDAPEKESVTLKNISSNAPDSTINQQNKTNSVKYKKRLNQICNILHSLNHFNRFTNLGLTDQDKKIPTKNNMEIQEQLYQQQSQEEMNKQGNKGKKGKNGHEEIDKGKNEHPIGKKNMEQTKEVSIYKEDKKEMEYEKYNQSGSTTTNNNNKESTNMNNNNNNKESEVKQLESIQTQNIANAINSMEENKKIINEITGCEESVSVDMSGFVTLKKKKRKPAKKGQKPPLQSQTQQSSYMDKTVGEEFIWGKNKVKNKIESEGEKLKKSYTNVIKQSNEKNKKGKTVNKEINYTDTKTTTPINNNVEHNENEGNTVNKIKQGKKNKKNNNNINIQENEKEKEKDKDRDKENKMKEHKRNDKYKEQAKDIRNKWKETNETNVKNILLHVNRNDERMIGIQKKSPKFHWSRDSSEKKNKKEEKKKEQELTNHNKESEKTLHDNGKNQKSTNKKEKERGGKNRLVSMDGIHSVWSERERKTIHLEKEKSEIMNQTNKTENNTDPIIKCKNKSKNKNTWNRMKNQGERNVSIKKEMEIHREEGEGETNDSHEQNNGNETISGYRILANESNEQRELDSKEFRVDETENILVHNGNIECNQEKKEGKRKEKKNKKDILLKETDVGSTGQNQNETNYDENVSVKSVKSNIQMSSSVCSSKKKKESESIADETFEQMKKTPCSENSFQLKNYVHNGHYRNKKKKNNYANGNYLNPYDDVYDTACEGVSDHMYYRNLHTYGYHVYKKYNNHYNNNYNKNGNFIMGNRNKQTSMKNRNEEKNYKKTVYNNVESFHGIQDKRNFNFFNSVANVGGMEEKYPYTSYNAKEPFIRRNYVRDKNFNYSYRNQQKNYEPPFRTNYAKIGERTEKGIQEEVMDNFNSLDILNTFVDKQTEGGGVGTGGVQFYNLNNEYWCNNNGLSQNEWIDKDGNGNKYRYLSETNWKMKKSKSFGSSDNEGEERETYELEDFTDTHFLKNKPISMMNECNLQMMGNNAFGRNLETSCNDEYTSGNKLYNRKKNLDKKITRELVEGNKKYKDSSISNEHCRSTSHSLMYTQRNQEHKDNGVKFPHMKNHNTSTTTTTTATTNNINNNNHNNSNEDLTNKFLMERLHFLYNNYMTNIINANQLFIEYANVKNFIKSKGNDTFFSRMDINDSLNLYQLMHEYHLQHIYKHEFLNQNTNESNEMQGIEFPPVLYNYNACLNNMMGMMNFPTNTNTNINTNTNSIATTNAIPGGIITDDNIKQTIRIPESVDSTTKTYEMQMQEPSAFQENKNGITKEKENNQEQAHTTENENRSKKTKEENQGEAKEKEGNNNTEREIHTNQEPNKTILKETTTEMEEGNSNDHANKKKENCNDHNIDKEYKKLNEPGEGSGGINENKNTDIGYNAKDMNINLSNIDGYSFNANQIPLSKENKNLYNHMKNIIESNKEISSNNNNMKLRGMRGGSVIGKYNRYMDRNMHNKSFKNNYELNYLKKGTNFYNKINMTHVSDLPMYEMKMSDHTNFENFPNKKNKFKMEDPCKDNKHSYPMNPAQMNIMNLLYNMEKDRNNYFYYNKNMYTNNPLPIYNQQNYFPYNASMMVPWDHAGFTGGYPMPMKTNVDETPGCNMGNQPMMSVNNYEQGEPKSPNVIANMLNNDLKKYKDLQKLNYCEIDGSYKKNRNAVVGKKGKSRRQMKHTRSRSLDVPEETKWKEEEGVGSGVTQEGKNDDTNEKKNNYILNQPNKMNRSRSHNGKYVDKVKEGIVLVNEENGKPTTTPIYNNDKNKQTGDYVECDHKKETEKGKGNEKIGGGKKRRRRKRASSLNLFNNNVNKEQVSCDEVCKYSEDKNNNMDKTTTLFAKDISKNNEFTTYRNLLHNDKEMHVLFLKTEEKLINLLKRVKPSKYIKMIKQNIFLVLSKLIKHLFNYNINVYTVGSTAYDVDSKTSDLDIVIQTNLYDPKFILHNIYNFIKEIKEQDDEQFAFFKNVELQLVESARVPILTLKKENIVCDVSINTNNSLKHTEFFWNTLRSFPNLKNLMRMLKFWLKVRILPSMKQGGLPTIVWMLLSVHYCKICTHGHRELLSSYHEKEEKEEGQEDKRSKMIQDKVREEQECSEELYKFTGRNADYMNAFCLEALYPFLNQAYLMNSKCTNEIEDNENTRKNIKYVDTNWYMQQMLSYFLNTNIYTPLNSAFVNQEMFDTNGREMFGNEPSLAYHMNKSFDMDYAKQLNVNMNPDQRSNICNLEYNTDFDNGSMIHYGNLCQMMNLMNFFYMNNINNVNPFDVTQAYTSADQLKGQELETNKERKNMNNHYHVGTEEKEKYDNEEILEVSDNIEASEYDDNFFNLSCDIMMNIFSNNEKCELMDKTSVGNEDNKKESHKKNMSEDSYNSKSSSDEAEEKEDSCVFKKKHKSNILKKMCKNSKILERFLHILEMIGKQIGIQQEDEISMQIQKEMNYPKDHIKEQEESIEHKKENSLKKYKNIEKKMMNICPLFYSLMVFFNQLNSRKKLLKTINIIDRKKCYKKDAKEINKKILSSVCHGGVWEELLTLYDPIYSFNYNAYINKTRHLLSKTFNPYYSFEKYLLNCKDVTGTMDYDYVGMNKNNRMIMDSLIKTRINKNEEVCNKTTEREGINNQSIQDIFIEKYESLDETNTIDKEEMVVFNKNHSNNDVSLNTLYSLICKEPIMDNHQINKENKNYMMQPYLDNIHKMNALEKLMNDSNKKHHKQSVSHFNNFETLMYQINQYQANVLFKEHLNFLNQNNNVDNEVRSVIGNEDLLMLRQSDLNKVPLGSVTKDTFMNKNIFANKLVQEQMTKSSNPFLNNPMGNQSFDKHSLKFLNQLDKNSFSSASSVANFLGFPSLNQTNHCVQEEFQARANSVNLGNLKNVNNLKNLNSMERRYEHNIDLASKVSSSTWLIYLYELKRAHFFINYYFHHLLLFMYFKKVITWLDRQYGKKNSGKENQATAMCNMDIKEMIRSFKQEKTEEEVKESNMESNHNVNNTCKDVSNLGINIDNDNNNNNNNQLNNKVHTEEKGGEIDLENSLEKIYNQRKLILHCILNNLNFCINALFEKNVGDVYTLPFQVEEIEGHQTKEKKNEEGNKKEQCELNNEDHVIIRNSIEENTGMYGLVLIEGKLILVKFLSTCVDKEKFWEEKFLCRRDIRSVIHCKSLNVLFISNEEWKEENKNKQGKKKPKGEEEISETNNDDSSDSSNVNFILSEEDSSEEVNKGKTNSVDNNTQEEKGTEHSINNEIMEENSNNEETQKSNQTNQEINKETIADKEGKKYKINDGINEEEPLEEQIKFWDHRKAKREQKCSNFIFNSKNDFIGIVLEKPIDKNQLFKNIEKDKEENNNQTFLINACNFVTRINVQKICVRKEKIPENIECELFQNESLHRGEGGNKEDNNNEVDKDLNEIVSINIIPREEIMRYKELLRIMKKAPYYYKNAKNISNFTKTPLQQPVSVCSFCKQKGTFQIMTNFFKFSRVHKKVQTEICVFLSTAFNEKTRKKEEISNKSHMEFLHSSDYLEEQKNKEETKLSEINTKTVPTNVIKNYEKESNEMIYEKHQEEEEEGSANNNTNKEMKKKDLNKDFLNGNNEEKTGYKEKEKMKGNEENKTYVIEGDKSLITNDTEKKKDNCTFYNNGVNEEEGITKQTRNTKNENVLECNKETKKKKRKKKNPKGENINIPIINT